MQLKAIASVSAVCRHGVFVYSCQPLFRCSRATNLTFTCRDTYWQHPKARRYCAMMQAARRGASLFTAMLHACRLQIRTFSLSRAEPKIIRTLPRRREAKEQFANYIRLLAPGPVPYRESYAATASGCTNGRRDIEPCWHSSEQCPAIYKQKIVLATYGCGDDRKNLSSAE